MNQLAVDSAHAATCDLLDHLFRDRPLQNVAFRLSDGAAWPDERPRPATVVLKHPGALRAMLISGTAKGLAEAYLRDDFDVEGDMEQAIELALALEHRPTEWLASLTHYYRLMRLPHPPANRETRRAAALHGQPHSLQRDRQAVSFHYDVSNDFYRLWLDSRMVYSCAYFTDESTSLESAQEAKLDHLCRKLRLRPGQHLLDIGCGWGGLAIHAVQKYQVEVTGVTVSARQAALAEERVRAAAWPGG